MAAVASLIQQFEGRAMHPELQQIAEQEHKEQPSDVEKPHTPPKRETPLMPLQRYPTSSSYLFKHKSPMSCSLHLCSTCVLSSTHPALHECLTVCWPVRFCSWLARYYSQAVDQI